MSLESADGSWLGTESEVCRAVDKYSRDCLRTYEIDQRRITADANIERTAIEGGYARRQLFELVQNGADELLDVRGRIEVVLTSESMYCANQGRPITARGVGALLGSHSSPKVGLEIGRFGLGFKSVLGITTSPSVFSTSGSFKFDRNYNLARVRKAVPGTERVATLRFAVPQDPRQEAQSDPILSELMGWAETVVKMPRDQHRDTSWLSLHIADFPTQFLLFSEHVAELVLDDRTAGLRRAIQLEQLGEHRWLLREAGDAAGETEWRVFGTTHRPSGAVKEDGGTMADRDEVPIQWAVPIGARGRSPGEFWAFFPTLERTTLSGVLNAPWKLNEDRTRLIEGPFNAELLERIVGLVVEGLPASTADDDPGAALDLLPGREKESRGWADSHLIAATYTALGSSSSLPDLNGEFRKPAELGFHPLGLPFAAIQLWSEAPRAPRNWVHPSAYRSDTRGSRVSRLAEVSGVAPARVVDWLEALIHSPTDARGSAAAVRVAAALIDDDPRHEVVKAKIVLTEKGTLVAPVRGALFLPAEEEVDVDVPLVADKVLAQTGAAEAFEALRIAVVSSDTVLDAMLDRAVSSDLINDWSRIWAMAAKVSPNRVRELFLNEHGLDREDVRVKTLGDGWASLASVLLPGDLLAVKDFKSGHRAALVDVDHHRRELDLLRQLGATDRPTAGAGSVDETWVDEYRKRLAVDAAKEAREHGARSRETHYVFEHPTAFAGPAGVLDGLSDEAAARYARELLELTPDLHDWRLGRENGKGASRPVQHPLLWRVRQLGRLQTNRGLQPIDVCITPLFKDFADLLPVADLPRPACRALGLPDTLKDLAGDGARATHALRAVEQIERGELLGPAYVRLMPVLGAAPERLRAIVRNEVVWASRAAVCAAPTIQDAKVLRGTGTPFLRVPDQESADALVGRWGLLSVADAVSSRLVVSEVGPPELLTDLFPMLALVLGPEVELLSVVACREIARELYTDEGSVTESKDLVIQDSTVYRSAELGDGDLVRRLAERLGETLAPDEVRRVLEHAQDANVQAMLLRVRKQPDDAAKLLELIGPETLRSRIPRELIEAVEETDGELDDEGTAELALNVFGVEVLKYFKDVLKERGVQPPPSWTGGRAAVQFVTLDLGLDRKYAGFAEIKPEKEMTIAGPSPLPPLHPFQRRSADSVRELLVGTGGKRGMLSLPTGAGKTRVAVQALTEEIGANNLASPVLWIAQTEELCEQAVQSWAEVWRSAGPRGTLRVSRLWGASSAGPREDEGPQVVVATINKLVDRCVDNPEYEWLQAGVSCVVVDEAHTSISAMHVTVLRWLGMDLGKERAPLIGLSATPFRGTSEVETERLVNRYGRRRLDKDAFEEEASITLLQREGILARVVHRVLEGSEGVPLTASERESFSTFKDVPSSVLTKIGGDSERTNRLVDSVMELDADWPVLLFASSVPHARTVAALLERRGRSAAAISADTPVPVRRHLVREFRAGRLDTLTNFGVLTQGFDAPSVRALYIARPTYSPNLYQQMIGRGLRGPKNGGKEECLVVDVADNVVLHGAELAFREFEYLWTA